jgi:Protein of unknown function (DUF1553)/Protein of unknown function (DUF1549)/Planctomycete cytochrome C
MRFPASLCLFALVGSLNAAEPARIDYLRDVKPLLQSRCWSCHGALRQKANLRLDTAPLIRKGGKSGSALIAHNSSGSLLIDAVAGINGATRMPPKTEGPALADKEIALLKAWIDQGGAAPQEAVPEDPRKHWAFQPPIRPPLPAIHEPEWAKNPIDAFLAAEYGKHGLHPVPLAARETLLRRVYLDLIGLPPTRDELHAFLADSSPDAYEKIVDRLLSSPRYGERWGRHWMDVWRYSDWFGRRAVPDVWNSAPQIWRWRDWIVQSLNADKGYDRMILEMLAADEIDPENDEAGVATGFLVRNWYALNPNQWMRDTVEHTGKAFLGLTFNCAHCHDHKYDPISQEEYFRFRAFFEPLGLRQDRWRGEADPGPFQKYDYSALRKIVPLGAVRVLDEKLDARTFMYRMGDERDRVAGREPVRPGAPAFLNGDRLRIEEVKLPTTAFYPGMKPWLQEAERERCRQAVASARQGLQACRAELAFTRAQREFLEAQAFDPKRPVPPTWTDARQRTPARLLAAERGVRLAEAKLARAEAEERSFEARLNADQVTYGRVQGDKAKTAQQASQAERLFALRTAAERLVAAEQTAGPNAAAQVIAAKKAVETARAGVAATGESYTPLTPVYPAVSTGRRTALARWIASRDNPLTARVAVNHIWLRHFDRPLVETVSDFGRNGKKPSHPELLDYLAVELMESGWSMKKLHRLMVTSRAYRLQSSPGDPHSVNLTQDADNRWLWHFPVKRVEAEVVRDSVLYAAGELDLTLGGPVLEITQEDASRRRSLYYAVHPEEGGHLRFLNAFDVPDPCDCYRRSSSVLPQQALALTNSQLLHEQSQALARKLSARHAEDDAFVTAAFEQMLTRGPTEREHALCRDFLRRQADLVRQAKAPDSPEQRAREGLIRVLFNHADFVTVR